MSHGNGNVTRANEPGIGGGGGGDEFGRALARVAVAQVCEGVGFQGAKDSALDSLADIAIRYLCDLGKTANFYANLTGRTDCNVFDLVRALEALEAPQGFSGAADVGRCLVGSGAVRELSRFVGSEPEVPFAQPVARFPVARNRRLIPSFLGVGESPPGSHIPAWLPAFPDPHTYVRTPMWNERDTDPREDKIEQVRQRRKAERSLFCLQQRLVGGGGSSSNGNGVAGGDEIENGITTTKQDERRNPFLEPPLRPGEKGVSLVTVQPPPMPMTKPCCEIGEVEFVSGGGGGGSEQGGMVLEAFAPAIEAVKNGFCDVVDEDGGGEEDGRTTTALAPVPVPTPVLARPAVNFKFRSAKKYLVESSDLMSLRKNSGGGERQQGYFPRYEERDDKKRRAEFILRQSVENPQELNQM